MMADLMQISYSDLDAYHQCARRYYYEKRLRMGTLPELATTAVKRGVLMHTLLEGARDGVLDEAQASALFAREQVTDLREQEVLRRAVRLVLGSAAYTEVTAGAAVRRERQFFLALRDPASSGSVRFLKGYIDIQGTRPDGSLLILDYKSGTRAEAQASDYEDQARCYALVGLADGHPSVEVRFIRPEVVGEDSRLCVGGDTLGAPPVPAQQEPAPQVFVLGSYAPGDYADIEANLISAIHDMERTGPDSSMATDAFACQGCPVPRVACPQAKHG